VRRAGHVARLLEFSGTAWFGDDSDPRGFEMFLIRAPVGGVWGTDEHSSTFMPYLRAAHVLVARPVGALDLLDVGPDLVPGHSINVGIHFRESYGFDGSDVSDFEVEFEIRTYRHGIEKIDRRFPAPSAHSSVTRLGLDLTLC